MLFFGFLAAIIAQIFNGTVSVFDKFLLQRVLRPATLAFWISFTALGAFLLLPFGFALPSGNQWFLDLAAGATFALSLMFMYEAFQKEELTRVVPIIGSLTPIFTLIISYFAFGELLNFYQFMAFLVLVLGIVLLTYRHSPKHSNWLIIACAILAAFGFALSSVLMKMVFTDQVFFSGLAFSRLGGLIIVPIVLLDRQSRNDIFRKREVPKHGNTYIFFAGRFFSGTGFVLVNFAYAVLSPAIVNALQGVQYAFLFILTSFLSRFWPNVLKESVERKIVFRKIYGLVCVIIGSIILSFFP